MKYLYESLKMLRRMYASRLRLCAAALLAGLTLSFSGCLSAVKGPAGLDSESSECIACHKEYDLKTHHPVGVDYAVVASKGGGYAPVSSLNPALRLVNGRIACTTCHAPYTAYDHMTLVKEREKSTAGPDPMLSMDNAGSAMCLDCHRK